jgi:acetyl-CoA C-acetyltransferase
MTVNKVCGSGLKAVMLGAQAIRLGDARVVVSGGMESMSNIPYLLEKAREGYRMGHGELVDAMIKDGLYDVYNKYLMGMAGELCAKECDVPREAQDHFAIESYKRAQAAQKEGRFKEEIIPVTVKDRKGETLVDEDEEPKRVQLDKLASLRPAFSKEGTVTAANASPLNDGAAALLLTSAEIAKARGYNVLARIVADSTAAVEPKWFTIAPVHALAKLYEKTKTKPLDWDLYEINEAFSGVTMAAMKDHGLPHDRVNVHGGAVSLGHPIGCSGARILVTLLHALKDRGEKRGIATLCIGGGEAVALGVELV